MLFSPWEVEVSSSGPSRWPTRPNLSDEEKATVRRALDEIRKVNVVNDWFVHPVDDTRYTDYLTRIEVPMDIAYVLKRLESDYYSCRMSVVADIKLIRDNCAKYNHELHDLTASANEMLQKVEQLVLSEEEIKSFHEFQKLAEESAQQRQPPAADRSSVGRASTIERTNARGTVRRRSSLENLPMPTIPRRNQRRVGTAGTTDQEYGRRALGTNAALGGNRRLAQRRSSGSAAAPTRRSLRNDQATNDSSVLQQPQQTLESLSSNGRTSRRGRSTAVETHMAGSRPQGTDNRGQSELSLRPIRPSRYSTTDNSASRRSSRVRTRTESYAEGTSDDDEAASEPTDARHSLHIREPSVSRNIRNRRRTGQSSGSRHQEMSMDSADADAPPGRRTRSSDSMHPAPHGGRTRRTRTTSNEQHSDNISDDATSDGAVGPHPRTRSQPAFEEPQPFSERALRSRENHGATTRFASSAQKSEHVSGDEPHGRARSPDSESRSRPQRETARRSLQSENSPHSDEDMSDQSPKAPVRRSSRRTRSSPDTFDEASSEEDKQAALPQARTSRRLSVQRANAATEANSSPEGNQSESEQAHEDKPGRKLAYRRSSGRRRVSSNGYRYSDANENDHSDQRANMRKRTSRKVESDEEDHSEQSEDEFEEEQNTQSSDDDSMEIVPSTTGRVSKRSRKSTRATTQRQTHPSANSRRATRGRTPSSYLDPSSSEFGSDVDNGDISESSTEKHAKRKRPGEFSTKSYPFLKPFRTRLMTLSP